LHTDRPQMTHMQYRLGAKGVLRWFDRQETVTIRAAWRFFPELAKDGFAHEIYHRPTTWYS
jgi:hypothetical protein